MNTKFALVVLAAAVSGCVDAPPPRPAEPAPQPVNLTKVYFYPSQGQSADQQERDRYDCHMWAVRQTGFDPSQHNSRDQMRAEVIPARSPGQTVGAAAVVGAVLGAAIAGPGNAGKGAVVGAMAGTVAGSAAVASDQAEAEAVNAAAARRNARGSSRYQHEASDYRRAMSACLTGRGYSVR